MKKILLVGNPNVGKTTLYNRLTGLSQKVGNRPGVTVTETCGRVQGCKEETLLCDLPGIYSLTPQSEDEKNAVAALLGNFDAVYCVIDATCLARGLFLLCELSRRRLPIAVILTMTDEAAHRGIRVDYARLSSLTGMPVYPVSAPKNEGFDALREAPLPPLSHPLTLTARNLADAVSHRRLHERSMSDRIDRVLTDRRFGVSFFLLVMATVFYTVFGLPGETLTRLFRGFLFGPLYHGTETLFLKLSLAPPLRAFLLEGVFGGVGSVVAFLPQIALLFLLLTLLEDSGYMARIAFLMQPYTSRIGLDGRAAISFLLGFGCTIPAIMSAGILPDARQRKRAVLLLPFISCSARVTVYGVFLSAFFPRYGWLVCFFLYGLGFLAVSLTAILLRAAFPSGEKPFCIEFPPYRRPAIRTLSYTVLRRVGEFLLRAGSVIFLVSTLLWLCGNLTPTGRLCLLPNESILYRIGRFLSPFFAPLGFGFPEAAAALLSGLGAKESILSTFGIMMGSGLPAEVLPQLFGKASALSFLTFVSLYVPCVATLTAMRREIPQKRSVILFLFYSIAVAYVFSFLVYRAVLLFT